MQDCLSAFVMKIIIGMSCGLVIIRYKDLQINGMISNMKNMAKMALIYFIKIGFASSGLTDASVAPREHGDVVPFNGLQESPIQRCRACQTQ